MPELPEVETIKRGLIMHLKGVSIKGANVRCAKLRWFIPTDLSEMLTDETIINIIRRGKYLLFQLNSCTLIVHLGMSGSLRLVSKDKPLIPHDHLDIVLNTGQLLRYNDPRRFGAILTTGKNWEQHPLLHSIGIEPLDEAFTADCLNALCLKHKMPIKSFLMNSKKIAGVGNIYAAEALFLAKINPLKPANQLTTDEYVHIVQAVKAVLEKAIQAGGTTLKDYVNSEGKPGYFSQQLSVYGREGLPCASCGEKLQSITLGNRSTVYCGICQKG